MLEAAPNVETEDAAAGSRAEGASEADGAVVELENVAGESGVPELAGQEGGVTLPENNRGTAVGIAIGSFSTSFPPHGREVSGEG